MNLNYQQIFIKTIDDNQINLNDKKKITTGVLNEVYLITNVNKNINKPVQPDSKFVYKLSNVLQTLEKLIK